MVEIRADFLEHFRPIGLAVRQGFAVADGVAADDEDVGIRAAAQDFGKCAHKGRKAPAGFQVAVDEGDDLVLASEDDAALLQGHVDVGIGADYPGVDTVVDDADAGLVGGRVAGALPAGRRQAPIAHFVADQIIGVLHAQPAEGLEVAIGIFGIEIEIQAPGPVIEFHVAEYRAVGPDFLEEQRLAPTGMDANDLGGKTLLLELPGQAGNGFAANDFGFGVLQLGMNGRSAVTGQGIRFHFQTSRP